MRTRISQDFYAKILFNKSMVMEIFSKRLKQLRLEKNLSQLQLANLTKITQSNIVRWEKGEQVPSIFSLITLAKFFECSIDYLVGLEDYY